jgi:hypothetical protein
LELLLFYFEVCCKKEEREGKGKGKHLPTTTNEQKGKIILLSLISHVLALLINITSDLTTPAFCHGRNSQL